MWLGRSRGAASILVDSPRRRPSGGAVVRLASLRRSGATCPPYWRRCERDRMMAVPRTDNDPFAGLRLDASCFHPRHKGTKTATMNQRTLGVAVLLGVLLGGALSGFAAEPTARETKDLLVLYTFERPRDDVIRDRSGVGEPLDLRIESPQAVVWRNGRLVITSCREIASRQPARKITAAVKQSRAVTIEAWVKPQDVRQAGPARIVSLSADTGQRNFTLGQNARSIRCATAHQCDRRQRQSRRQRPPRIRCERNSPMSCSLAIPPDRRGSL